MELCARLFLLMLSSLLVSFLCFFETRLDGMMLHGCSEERPTLGIWPCPQSVAQYTKSIPYPHTSGTSV
eukprot:6487198-Amphidinium_carterae.1